MRFVHVFCINSILCSLTVNEYFIAEWEKIGSRRSRDPFFPRGYEVRVYVVSEHTIFYVALRINETRDGKRSRDAGVHGLYIIKKNVFYYIFLLFHAFWFALANRIAAATRRHRHLHRHHQQQSNSIASLARHRHRHRHRHHRLIHRRRLVHRRAITVFAPSSLNFSGVVTRRYAPLRVITRRYATLRDVTRTFSVCKTQLGARVAITDTSKISSIWLMSVNAKCTR